MPHPDFTLSDVLVANARRHGDRPALAQAHTTTHKRFLERCESLAAGLQQFGIEPGDRIAVLSRNRIEFMELIGAAARIGAVVSAINWRLSVAEVGAVLENDDPKVVVAEDEFWPLLGVALARPASPCEFVCIDARREGFWVLEAFESEDAPHDVAVAADDPLLMIHTAWTDGRPKAAMLSHRNVLANAVQLQLTWRLGPNDVHLCCLPLFHSTALSLCFATLLAGGCSVLAAKFDPTEAVRQVEKHRVTVFAEFAPMLQGMLDAAGGSAGGLASLRHLCGLDSPETIQRFEASCPGATFWTGYGQSEASGLVSLSPFKGAEGSVGYALPLCAVEIVDDDGQAVPAGSVGEIAVRGPTVFLGYWQRPEDSRWAFRSGRLHTGDAGRMDPQGRLRYEGRMESKELIKTGGENVYPQEVEAVLRQHPQIEDVAVIGIHDPKWGESVRAICVVESAPPSPQEIIDFVGKRIAHFKRPRSVLFVAGLPKKADGSVDRQKTRALYGESQAA